MPDSTGRALVAKIRSLVEPYGLREVTLRMDQPSNLALKLDLDGFREIAFLMPALILLAAAASLFVMLGRYVQAQRTQIGIMRAIGYTSRSILLHYLAYSLVIGLAGSLIGILCGYPLGNFVTSAYTRELGIPLVVSRLYADSVLIGVGMSLVVASLAGLFPARRASLLAPAAAVRPDPTNASARPFRPLSHGLFRLSVWSRLAFRNLFRMPSRTLSTLVGVVFAFVLVLTSWSLIDSMKRIVAYNFTRVERWTGQGSMRS